MTYMPVKKMWVLAKIRLLCFDLIGTCTKNRSKNGESERFLVLNPTTVSKAELISPQMTKRSRTIVDQLHHKERVEYMFIPYNLE